jgi:hypothetical protein
MLAAKLLLATATLAGGVKYNGKVPPKNAINKGAPASCGTDPVYDESIIVDDKTHALANVVVWVDGAPASGTAGPDVTLDQKGCRYLPHVQAGVVGAKLNILNSDDAFHTAHAYAQGEASLYNVATPARGSKVTRSLEAAGPMHFKCDAGHTWMSAWIYVLQNPYFAVSGADGKFTIPLTGLPPGTYTVRAWHEQLGEATTKVVVEAGKSPKPIELELK